MPMKTILEVEDNDCKMASIDYSFRRSSNEEKLILSIQWRGDTGRLSYFGMGSDIKLLRQKDSMVFLSPPTNPVVFKRISAKPVLAPLLMSGAYEMSSVLATDTIEFFPDSTFINYSEVSIRRQPWEISRYKDYQFLLVGELEPPLIVTEISKNQVQLKAIAIKEFAVTLRKLNPKIDSALFYGEWIQDTWIMLDSSMPPPIVNKLKVKIKPGVVLFGEEEKPLPFVLSFNQDYLLFTNNGVWRILEATKTTLLIERRRGSLSRDRDRIGFKRVSI